MSLPRFPLTRHLLLFVFDYDKEKGRLIWKNPPKKHSYLLGKIAGTIPLTGHRYLRAGIQGKIYLVHQLIWFIETGKFVPIIDHIDGNGLNNNFSNLRESNNRLNQSNRKRHRSGFLVGASWDKNRKSWFSKIQIKGTQLYLGRFGSQEEAHQRYLEALKEYDV